MNWKDVNVFQYQQLILLNKEKDSVSQEELGIKSLSILYNKTENQIRNMSINEINKLSESLDFIKEPLKPEHKEYIYCGKKRYRFNYDVKQMQTARYIESKYFLRDFETNIHKIAASMVIPQRWSLLGYKDKEYDSKKHNEYAEDLLNAPITEVLGSVVFFYLAYNDWIKSSKDYLVKQMIAMKMTPKVAEFLYLALCRVSDGFIKQVSLPSLNESDLKKFTDSLRFNS